MRATFPLSVSCPVSLDSCHQADNSAPARPIGFHALLSFSTEYVLSAGAKPEKRRRQEPFSSTRCRRREMVSFSFCICVPIWTAHERFSGDDTLGKPLIFLLRLLRCISCRSSSSGSEKAPSLGQGGQSLWWKVLSPYRASTLRHRLRPRRSQHLFEPPPAGVWKLVLLGFRSNEQEAAFRARRAVGDIYIGCLSSLWCQAPWSI